MNYLPNLGIAVVAGLITAGIVAAFEQWRDALTQSAPYLVMGIFVFFAVATASALGTIIALRIMAR
jgi:hypothetical protein